MNPFRSNIGTLNEILFENKNKSYGAYALRAAYENTLLKSLGITAAIIVGTFWILSLIFSKEVEVIIPDTADPQPKVIEINIEPPKPDQPPTAEDNHNNNNTQRNNSNPVVIDHAQDSVAVNSNITPPVTPPTPGTGTATTTNTTTVAPPTFTTEAAPTTIPDVFPAFDGLKKFWAENIKYPNEARELNVEGKVAINFIIDENGKIISCKILKKLGFGCDEEVLRVAALMPNWKPGMVNGKPVKVSLSQVIDFKLK